MERPGENLVASARMEKQAIFHLKMHPDDQMGRSLPGYASGFDRNGNFLRPKNSGGTLCLLMALGWMASCPAATYYVDSLSGDDVHDGSSAQAPFKTLSKLQEKFSEGDRGLLRAGGRWDELFLFDGKANGSLLGKYGEGTDPIISAADRVVSWKCEESFPEAVRWSKATLGWVPHTLWVSSKDHDAIYSPVTSLEAATRKGTWYYEQDSGTLRVVLPEGLDPNDPGVEINVGRRDVCIRISSPTRNVTLQNLHLKYTNAIQSQWAALHGENVIISGWTLKNLLIEWANLGTKLTGDYSQESILSLDEVEIRCCREHGFNAVHFVKSKIRCLHSHDNGRSGGQFQLRDSLIEECETDHNADKNHHWPESQRAAVQPWDSGFYIVGDEAHMLPAGRNVIRRCRSHHNAKAGMATDALCDNNLFENNLFYLNDLMGLFFEGGTSNGSYGNKAFNNSFYKNGLVTSGNFNVANGHGAFEMRNNIFFGGGGQEIGINWGIHTWKKHSGNIYKRTHMRWKPGVVGDEKNRLLTAGKSADTLEPGQYFYDSAHETLCARHADDSPISTLRISPEEKPILDYNCYAPVPGRPLMWEEAPGAATSLLRNLAEMQKMKGREVHGMQADPLYAGPE